MTFWGENYGFVKDVYEYRIAKYQEWMDNLENIVAKVMLPNVQYTFKEFKNIKDTLASLCRDLEKEGMKEWLDLMLEKVAVRVSDDAGPSSRDKEFKAQEKKRLQALIDRHDKLMPSTQETQAKVEIYARCYAYGDDISACLKTLEEMRHLSVKEIHPHNMNMVDEQIEKAEKVIATVESQRDQYDEFLKRGQKLVKNPNAAPFLAGLIEKLETTWKEANEKSQSRCEMLKNSAKDWGLYDEMRAAINDPLEKMEAEFKRYRKFFDPTVGTKKFNQKKGILDEQKAKTEEMYNTMKKCYTTIVVLAGDDKKEFLDKEVGEVDEKKKILDTCEKKLASLVEYNDKLTKAVGDARALNDWATPTNHELNELVSSEDMSPEDRTKNILNMQEISRTKLPLVEPLRATYKELLHEEDLEKSETAKNTMADFEEIAKFVTEVCEEIEKEAGSITSDQRLYADYLCAVKEFTPWMEESEKKATTPLAKPNTMDEALALLADCEEFNGICDENKTKLDAANKARGDMEKASNTPNECEPLGGRWDVVKKTTTERVEKVKSLVETWTELKGTTENLAEKMAEVPKQEEPNLEDLEKVFNSMKDLFNKKKDLLASV